MIILLNLPTYMNGLLRMRDIFSEGGSGTIKFDMNTSTDHLWQYVAYTIKPPRTPASGARATLVSFSNHYTTPRHVIYYFPLTFVV